MGCCVVLVFTDLLCHDRPVHLGGLAVAGLTEDRQEDDPSVWGEPVADPPGGTAKVETQFSDPAAQVSAVRFAESGGRFGKPICVVLNRPIVGQWQRVQPLSYLGLQFDVVPAPHIREHIVLPGARVHNRQARHGVASGSKIRYSLEADGRRSRFLILVRRAATLAAAPTSAAGSSAGPVTSRADFVPTPRGSGSSSARSRLGQRSDLVTEVEAGHPPLEHFTDVCANVRLEPGPWHRTELERQALSFTTVVRYLSLIECPLWSVRIWIRGWRALTSCLRGWRAGSVGWNRVVKPGRT